MSRAGRTIARYNGRRSQWFERDLVVLLPTATGRDIDDRQYVEWEERTYRGRREQSVEPQEDTNAFGQQVIVESEFIIDKAAPLESPPESAAIDSYPQPPRIREGAAEYAVVHPQDGKTGRWVVTATRVDDPVSDDKITTT